MLAKLLKLCLLLPLIDKRDIKSAMGKNLFHRTLCLTAAIALASPSTAVYADQSSGEAQDIRMLAETLRMQSERLAEQEARLKVQFEELERQKQEVKRLSDQFGSMQEAVVTKDELNVLRGAGPSSGALSATAPAAIKEKNDALPQEVGTERKPEPADRPPEIAANIEEGGVLLPKGRLVLTPGMEYTNSSATRVSIEGFSIIPALNIGLFEITELKRDTLNAFVSARYGITNRIEIEGKVPFLYRQDSTRNRPIGVGTSSDILTNVDGYGLGDVEVGAHYQINDGQEGWPFFIANLRFKSTTGSSPFEVDTDPATGLATELATGSGFYALQPSVTAIYPQDPVVFYSNMGYLMNFAHDYGGTTGEIDPGDSVSAGLGFSLAFNEKSSFSLGYSHSTIFRAEQEGHRIPNTTNLQVGTLDFGYSYQLFDTINLNFNVSAGVTEDAPDVTTTFRVPISFDL